MTKKKVVTAGPCSVEHHIRVADFGRLCNEGHVRVINDDDPHNIRCRIEKEVFAEPRSIFPSTQLMARLQLAIAAGLSCTKLPRESTDAYRYAIRGMKVDRVWIDEMYGRDAEVTAAVKGLRP